MIPDIQIIKSLSRKFDLPVSNQIDFTKQFAAEINHLIQNDFPRLVQILYQMDISESKLKEMLVMDEGHDAGSIITHLLIEREKQKIQSREQYKRSDDIPENEKW